MRGKGRSEEASGRSNSVHEPKVASRECCVFEEMKAADPRGQRADVDSDNSDLTAN